MFITTGMRGWLQWGWESQWPHCMTFQISTGVEWIWREMHPGRATVLSLFAPCRTIGGIARCSHLTVEVLACESLNTWDTCPSSTHPCRKYRGRSANLGPGWSHDCKCVFTEHLMVTFCYNHVLWTALQVGGWRPCVQGTWDLTERQVSGIVPIKGTCPLQSLTWRQTEHRRKHSMVGYFLPYADALWWMGDALKMLLLLEKTFTLLYCWEGTLVRKSHTDAGWSLS